MPISLAITTLNRFEMTVKSFEKVIYDDRIDDIVILDDCSTDGSFEKLNDAFGGEDKVRVIRQFKNRGMARNKFEAIGYCRNRRVIILDSDNTIDTSYIDSMFVSAFILPHMGPDSIMVPEFAMPGFDFTQWTGLWIDSKMAKSLMQYPMFRCLLNCCNYVVPRDEYLSVYQDDENVKGTDTINFAYRWLKEGNTFYVVPGMRYHHLQHAGSGFLADIDYNMANAKEVEQKIMEL